MFKLMCKAKTPGTIDVKGIYFTCISTGGLARNSCVWEKWHGWGEKTIPALGWSSETSIWSFHWCRQSEEVSLLTCIILQYWLPIEYIYMDVWYFYTTSIEYCRVNHFSLYTIKKKDYFLRGFVKSWNNIIVYHRSQEIISRLEEQLKEAQNKWEASEQESQQLRTHLEEVRINIGHSISIILTSKNVFI